MANDYVPNEDAQFSIWAQAFANGISDDPARFMMTSAQAASILSVVNAFVAALLVASTESTRTKPAIISKDNARSVCESLCRQYAMLIKQNDGIADEDKVAIGVRPENPTREKIDCPQSVPVLNVVAATPGAQTVRFADSVDPENRAKPFGASEILLFRAVTDGPNPAPFTEARFYGKFTRNPVAVEFDQPDDGKLATYYARWASVRGETSPLSFPVAMRIAA